MDQETVRTFAARVNRGDLGPDVQVRYHVAGGMPSQRLECEVVVDSANGARVTRYDALVSDESASASFPPEELDVPEFLESISRGLPSLTPVSERVTRRPDSLVGRLTIVVEGAEEAFHFVPEREKRGPDDRVAPAMDRALQLLWDLATGSTREKGGADHA
jgi:hypothetical protein